MEIIGIVAEYNPFHNGHLYQINKIKEMYKDSLIIVVTSSSFCERGEISILNKWDKTKIALNNGIDIMIELPFVYSSQSADIFAYGALKILNELKINKLIFGSEINDVEKLKKIAKLEIESSTFNEEVKEIKKTGINHPTALSKIIEKHLNTKVSSPNDLLAISYIKEIIKNNYSIEPISIKRTNDYHSLSLNSNIISAKAIRTLVCENKDITNYVPKEVITKVYKNTSYFDILKYKILSEENIEKYQTVDEGIENKIKKEIINSNTLDELIIKIKSKRYTYNKINRMLIHILTSFTKEEANNINISYIRVLGFNIKGKEYLNKIKKDITIPIITNYKKGYKELDIEYRITKIYSYITKDTSLILKELDKPIIKEE